MHFLNYEDKAMYDFIPKNYFEKFGEILIKSNERLEKYLADPNEENIHDVRTSIRRLDATWKVLPKETRQDKKILKFVTLRKEFFKINSEIRDFDIIKQKISIDLSDDIKEIIKKLDQKKESKLRSAQKKAKVALQTKIIKIDQNEVLQDKLEKRFKKITLRLINKIEGLIPIVTSSDKKVEQLHELRKDCKRLRYLLELTTYDKSSRFINKLKEMQDILGSIRDCDITIDFLKKLTKKPDSVKIRIGLELEKRGQVYKKFLDMEKF